MFSSGFGCGEAALSLGVFVQVRACKSPCVFSPGGVGFDIMTLRAHFDGAVIVPDEPIPWPAGTPLSVEIQPLTDIPPNSPSVAASLQALDWFAARAVAGPPIPDEELRRERLYADEP